MHTTEERLDALEARNKRVESNKAWETSLERRSAILILTYIVIGVFLGLINTPHAWINAIVPSVGFLLSTLTLGWLKERWLQRHNQANS